jgi:hypothetical protein
MLYYLGDEKNRENIRKMGILNESPFILVGTFAFGV